jgi:hypothetical protein
VHRSRRLGSSDACNRRILNGGAGKDGAVRLLSTVPIPATKANTTAGKMYVFDVSFVDPTTQTYYLADRSNAVVDVVDARTNKLVSQISATPAFKGFTGTNATSGPNGVVAAFPWLFVNDANSRVVTIDLRNGKTVGDVSTGGARGLRADEMAYDPKDGLLLAVNNADTPPFATLMQRAPPTRLPPMPVTTMCLFRWVPTMRFPTA